MKRALLALGSIALTVSVHAADCPHGLTVSLDFHDQTQEVAAAQDLFGAPCVKVFHNSEAFQAFAKSGETFDTLIISGHAAGDLFWVDDPTKWEFTVEDLVATLSPEQRASIKNFYGLGCYTSGENGDNAAYWLRNLPNAEFFAGFTLKGPTGATSADFLRNVEKTRRRIQKEKIPSDRQRPLLAQAMGGIDGTSGAAGFTSRGSNGSRDLHLIYDGDEVRGGKIDDVPIFEVSTADCLQRLASIRKSEGGKTLAQIMDPHRARWNADHSALQVTQLMDADSEDDLRHQVYEKILEFNNCKADFFMTPQAKAFFLTPEEAALTPLFSRHLFRDRRNEVIIRIKAETIASNFRLCARPFLSAMAARFKRCASSKPDTATCRALADKLDDLATGAPDYDPRPGMLAAANLSLKLNAKDSAATKVEENYIWHLLGRDVLNPAYEKFPIETWDLLMPGSPLCKKLDALNAMASDLHHLSCSQAPTFPTFTGFADLPDGKSAVFVPEPAPAPAKSNH